jgi:hypothetical protein
MLKRVNWTDDAVFSLRLRDDLYTLVQMRRNHIMQFFDLWRADGSWKGVDLGAERSLFFAFVAEQKLKSLLVERVDTDSVRPSNEPIPRVMLSAVIGAGTYGANLVELTPDFSSYGARVLKENLSPEGDLELIHKHELVGMLGDSEKLRQRLVRYVETGVNWDNSKSFIFKGIKLPEPRRAQSKA